MQFLYILLVKNQNYLVFFRDKETEKNQTGYLHHLFLSNFFNRDDALNPKSRLFTAHASA